MALEARIVWIARALKGPVECYHPTQKYKSRRSPLPKRREGSGFLSSPAAQRTQTTIHFNSKDPFQLERSFFQLKSRILFLRKQAQPSWELTRSGEIFFRSKYYLAPKEVEKWRNLLPSANGSDSTRPVGLGGEARERRLYSAIPKMLRSNLPKSRIVPAYRRSQDSSLDCFTSSPPFR